VLRLTGSEQAVAEVAATAEHVASLTAAAAAFQLPADPTGYPTDPSGTAITLLDEKSVPEAVETLGEIGAWARDALGSDQMPSLWRAPAHRPRLLATVWRKHRLVLSAGVLDERTKACAGLATAQFRRSPYLVAYLGRLLRHSFGFDDGALVELAAMTMHALAFNTIAGGMLLEAPFDELAAADFVPGGRLERARRPGEPSRPVTPSNRG
jgi:hypothetical protein